MSEPIKKGDLAIIIYGFNGNKSPNVGKIVTVGMMAGDHPTLGPMVKIHGENLIIENRPPANECNILISWLKKVNGPPLPTKTKTKELDTV